MRKQIKNNNNILTVMRTVVNWAGGINIGQVVRSAGVETAGVARDVEGMVDELTTPATEVTVFGLTTGFTSTTQIRS